jgi:hypothetical protein
MGGFVKYNIKIYWRKILKMLFDDRCGHNKKVEIKVVISNINFFMTKDVCSSMKWLT